jgi:hypothetical protein
VNPLEDKSRIRWDASINKANTEIERSDYLKFDFGPYDIIGFHNGS